MSTQCHLTPRTGLPIEVFLRCCSFLDYPSLCSAERVSRAWHQALSTDRDYDFDLTQLETPQATGARQTSHRAHRQSDGIGILDCEECVV